MENFLPALLIIGGVIYKIYTEYQKEQEKARRRMPQVPPPPTPPVTYGQRPQQTVIEPTIQIPAPLPPKVKQSREVPDEVKRIRERRAAEIKSRQKVMTALKAIELEEEKEEEKELSFDLREAVIQSAILNRPYQ